MIFPCTSYFMDILGIFYEILLKANIEDSQNYKLQESVLISSASLKGGEERIIPIQLHVSSSVLKQEATTINVNIEYQTRDRESPTILQTSHSGTRRRIFKSNTFIPPKHHNTPHNNRW